MTSPELGSEPADTAYGRAVRVLLQNDSGLRGVARADGAIAVIRRHELLVAATARERLTADLPPSAIVCTEEITPSVLRVTVAPDIDVIDVVTRLAVAGRRREVAPNHILLGCESDPTTDPTTDRASSAPDVDDADDIDDTDDAVGASSDEVEDTHPDDVVHETLDGTLDTSRKKTDPNAPARGEWWGGVPDSGRRGRHGPASPMSAQGGTAGFSRGSVAASGSPRSGSEPTSLPPGEDETPLGGEWWGGPVGSPVPVDPFGPPETAPVAAAAFDEGTGQPTPTTRTARIAILDTGIVSHPWWAEAAWFDHVAPDDIENLGDNARTRPLAVQAGHGTFVAGVTLQHAPTADLVIQRVLANDGLCDEAAVIRVLHDLAQLPAADAIDAVNLSFGGYTYDDQEPPLVTDAIRALPPGTAVIAAAGNFASDRVFWPAALPDVVGVGALTADGERVAKFSNYGSWVDVYRVGVRVRSSYVEYPACEDPDGHENPAFFGYARWNGTSFSAPAMTGDVVSLAASSGSTARAAAAQLVADERGVGT